MATDNNNEKNAAEIRRAMTEDKDKIAAALNNALADTRGNPIKTPAPAKKPVGRTRGQGKKAAPKAENAPKNDDASPVDMKFAEACYNLKIDAKMCHEESAKKDDPSIEEYVRSINKKIFDETRQGGYSTNVQFRVLPNDWVNVNHIIDWYTTRGFKVDMKETTTPPYGKDVGTINYHFTISWAMV